MNLREPEDDLRDVLRPTPSNAPADIDAAIRKHARQAIDKAPASGLYSGKRPGRWLLRTLPVAAVVVLAIGLIPRMQQEPASIVAMPAPETQQSPREDSTESLAESAPSIQQRAPSDAEDSSDAGIASSASTGSAQFQLRQRQEQRRQSMKSSVEAEAPDPSVSLQRDSKMTTENDAVPGPARTAFRNILELLRVGNVNAAQVAYRRWRQAWPDAEAELDKRGMSEAEIDWFKTAADRFEASQ